MTDQEKYAQMQELMDNFINNIAQRANESNVQSQSIEDVSDESIVQSQSIEDSQDTPTSSHNDETSIKEEDFSWTDNNDDEDELDLEGTPEYGSTQDYGNIFDNDDTCKNRGTQDYNNIQIKDKPSRVKTAKEEDDFSLNKEDWKKAWEDAMYSMKSMYDAERVRNERRKPEQPKQCDDIVFKKNTLMCNGQPFEYKVLQREVDWGIPFTKSFSMDSKINNLDKLNEKIIDDLVNIFGDLSRITEVAVISGMLIVNGVQYYPLCNNQDFLNGLPFDCLDYFKEGLIGEFFDYGYLTYMPNLVTLKVDSMEFAMRKLAPDLNLSGNFTVNGVFKRISSLKYLEIGDEGFTYPVKSKKSKKDDSESFEDRVSVYEKVDKMYNNFIVGNISTFRNWNFNNLKTYACNRGEKGFFRYSGGILMRGAGTALVGTGELGLRMAGGLVRGSFKLLKKAFTEL